jgi:Na+/H+ antiporter NhaD/arsenite permease-like protein
MAAFGAAMLLITRTVEPRLVYDEIDWGLLVPFTGLFIIVRGRRAQWADHGLLRPVRAWNLIASGSMPL